MQGLQSLSSPLTTTQNPRLHLAPSLSFQSSTKRTAFNPNIWSKKLSVKCQQYFQQQRLAIGTAPSNSFSSQPPGGGSTTVPGSFFRFFFVFFFRFFTPGGGEKVENKENELERCLVAEKECRKSINFST